MTARRVTTARRMAAKRRGPLGSGGSMSLELAIMTPILVGFMLLMVSLGRIVEAQSQVDGAARDAVRAASIAREPLAAGNAARLAARTTMSGRPDNGGARAEWCMGGPTTSVDLTGWAPGGQVTVTVTCKVDLSGLSLIAVAPTKTVTGTATAPLDTLRRVD
jgi:Flp pilus assembly protein TadG